MKRRLVVLWLAGALGLTGESPDAARWWAHVAFLASDALQGRETGGEQHRIAARYVAAEFERVGLRPAGTDGYVQAVALRSDRVDEAASSLELQEDGTWKPLALGDDAYFNSRGSASGDLEAGVVFTGYGFAAPQSDFDELAGLDLNGKFAMYLSGGPKHLPAPIAAHFQSLEERAKRLQAAGVKGIIVIPNPRVSDIPWERAKLARSSAAMRLRDASMHGRFISLTVNPSKVNAWMAQSGHTVDELLECDREGRPLPKFELKVRLRARLRLSTSELVSENVVALKPGVHPQRKREYIVLSAHLDHVGVGRPVGGDAIYNGAMDNAAGVATLLELARLLKDRRLDRSVVFAAVTGEEKGLLGSRHFVLFPTVPRQAIVANLNFDMFLPLYPFERLTVVGLGESTLGALVQQVAARAGIAVQADPEPQRNSFIRSDQYSFIRHGIPALAFKIGYAPGSAAERTFKSWLKERYHAPSDDLAQPVDKEAAAAFNRLMADLVVAAANAHERPAWNANSFFGGLAR